jgi:hypothetical protein
MAIAPGDADYKGDAVKSPTTLVMEYLAKNKMSPNMPGYSAAVREALAANAKDPTLIPGLRADRASTEEEDQAAMKAAGPSVGRRGNVSTQIESIETPQGGTPDKSPDRTPAPGTTSASPDDQSNSYPNLGLQIAIPAAFLGAGALAGQPSAARSPWPPSPQPVTGQPGPNETIDYTQLDPGRGSAMGEPPVSPMTEALNVATAPRTGVPSVGDSVPPMPDIGPVPQPRIPAGPGSAVLPPDLGSPPPQTIPSGPNTQVRPTNMPENAPRVPMPNRVNAPPTPADFYHPSWRTVAGPLARAILGRGR